MRAKKGVLDLEDVRNWLVRNYGPRCTLVCAVSVLRFMGARSHRLMEVLEKETRFREKFVVSSLAGVPISAYLGVRPRLDRAIQRAGREGGIAVQSRTCFVFSWQEIAESIDGGIPVVLNCFRAPGGTWNHSVIVAGYEINTRRLLTIDPNDGKEHWMTWRHLRSGWACTATFIKRA